MKGPLIYYDIKDMYGSDLSSKKLAAELRQSILEEIDLGFNVEIDFKDVRSLSNGWITNSFGNIVKSKGGDFFKNHILLSNMSKRVKLSIEKGINQTV